MDGGAVGAVEFGDFVDVGAGKEHDAYGEFGSVEFRVEILGSAGAAEFEAFFLAAFQSFFGALTDEVSFNFCAQAKRKCQDFTLNVISKTIVVLDCPDSRTFFHNQV